MAEAARGALGPPVGLRAPGGESRWGPRFRLAVRLVLGASLLVAGALKIAQPGDFYSALLAYDVAAPDFALRLIAVIFPCLEAICGVALLAYFWRETVGFLVAAICLIFVLLLGQAVLRGLDLRCGCFGAEGSTWLDHPLAALLRAVVMFGGAAWLWLQRSEPQAEPDNSLSARLPVRLPGSQPSRPPDFSRTPTAP